MMSKDQKLPNVHMSKPMTPSPRWDLRIFSSCIYMLEVEMVKLILGIGICSVIWPSHSSPLYGCREVHSTCFEISLLLCLIQGRSSTYIWNSSSQSSACIPRVSTVNSSLNAAALVVGICMQPGLVLPVSVPYETFRILQVSLSPT